jgi:hypothetical protein
MGDFAAFYKTNCRNVEAIELFSNPPWRGTHLRGYKASLRACGLRWQSNDYKRPEYDAFGYYETSDPVVLHKVMRLRTYDDEERLWPTDLAESVCAEIQRVATAFAHRGKQNKRKATSAAAEPLKSAAESAAARAAAGEAARRRELRVWDDSDRDLQRLADFYDIDADTVRRSAVLDIGPRSGHSDANRVLRALRYRLITPESLRSSILERERAQAQVAMSVHSEQHTRWAESSHGWFVANEPVEQNVLVHPDDDADAEPARGDGKRRAATTAAIAAFATTTCGECRSVVHINQFSDCSCGRVWEWCAKCARAYSADQACQCG